MFQQTEAVGGFEIVCGQARFEEVHGIGFEARQSQKETDAGVLGRGLLKFPPEAGQIETQADGIEREPAGGIQYAEGGFPRAQNVRGSQKGKTAVRHGPVRNADGGNFGVVGVSRTGGHQIAQSRQQAFHHSSVGVLALFVKFEWIVATGYKESLIRRRWKAFIVPEIVWFVAAAVSYEGRQRTVILRAVIGRNQDAVEAFVFGERADAVGQTFHLVARQVRIQQKDAPHATDFAHKGARVGTRHALVFNEANCAGGTRSFHGKTDGGRVGAQPATTTTARKRPRSAPQQERQSE